MTIRNKMIFSIICFVIVPMFFLPVFIFSAYKEIVEDKINTSTQQTLSQITQNIGTVFDNMITASNMLCFDRDLIGILRDYKDLSGWKKYLQQAKIEDKITNAKNTALYPYNADVVIIDFRGNIFSSSSFHADPTYQRIIPQSWFRRTVALNGYMLWMAPLGDQISLTGEDKQNIAMARLIKDPSATHRYGVILISLYLDMKLGALLQNNKQPDGEELFLLNDQAKVILSNNRSNLGSSMRFLSKYLNIESQGSFTRKIAGQNTVINYDSVPKTNWKIVQMVPYKVLMKDIDRLRSYQIVISLIFLGALILVAVFISWGITHPLHRLSLLMREVPKGNFAVRAMVKGRDEVAELGKSFNVMVREIEELIRQIQEIQALKEKTRLEALQAQINPHFLFNTLNNIKWLASLNGAETVSQMIAALGKLLETTLGKTDELIALADEIQWMESYVLLQKMRYGDKFAICYEIAEELLTYPVPHLLLQPLVENAIIHGFEDLSCGGRIIIRGYLDARRVLIEVEDNGKGISAEKIKDLLTTSNRQSGRFSNIGLMNVNERIRLFYGKDYGIEIVSHEGGGALVRVLLPRAGGAECSNY